MNKLNYTLKKEVANSSIDIPNSENALNRIFGGASGIGIAILKYLNAKPSTDVELSEKYSCVVFTEYDLAHGQLQKFPYTW